MSLPADQFCIRLGSPPLLIRKPKEFAGSYYYCEYSLGGMPYKMAVCSSDKQFDTELHMEFTL